MTISFNKELRQCENISCDRWFEPGHPSQKYHNLTCKYAASYAKQKQKWIADNPRELRTCKFRDCCVQFVAKRKNQYFHTEKCRIKEFNQRDADNYRAKKAGLKHVEVITRLPVEPDTPPKEGGPYYRVYDGAERRLHWVPVPTELEMEGPAESTDNNSWHDVLDIWREHSEWPDRF